MHRPIVERGLSSDTSWAEFVDSKAQNPLWQRFYKILWTGLTAFPSQHRRTQAEKREFRC